MYIHYVSSYIEERKKEELSYTTLFPIGLPSQ